MRIERAVRPSSLLSIALLGALFSACGPEPEPQSAATVPSTSATVVTSATAEPLPPPEPTAAELKAQAKAAIDAKDWAKARATLLIVVGKDGKDVEAWQLLGDASAGAGDAKAATDAYMAASKAEDGKSESLALTAAKGLLDQRRWDELISVAQGALKNNGASIPLWINLALGQMGKGDDAASAESWSKLSGLMPDEPHFSAMLAMAQARGGKTDDAKKTAKLATEKWVEARKPKTSRVVLHGKGPAELAIISRALRWSGDNAGAITVLAKYTVPQDETAPELDVERSLAKRGKHDAAGAKADAEKALKAAGNGYGPGLLALAGASAEAKKTEDAQKQLAGYDAVAATGGFWVVAYARDRQAIETSLTAPAYKAVPVKKTK
jgi:hypothetical protein